MNLSMCVWIELTRVLINTCTWRCTHGSNWHVVIMVGTHETTLFVYSVAMKLCTEIFVVGKKQSDIDICTSLVCDDCERNIPAARFNNT